MYRTLYLQDPTQPLTDDTGEVEVAPEQKGKKEKKKTVLEAGGDTTEAPSAAAVTILNNLPENPPNIRGKN